MLSRWPLGNRAQPGGGSDPTGNVRPKQESHSSSPEFRRMDGVSSPQSDNCTISKPGPKAHPEIGCWEEPEVAGLLFLQARGCL